MHTPVGGCETQPEAMSTSAEKLAPPLSEKVYYLMLSQGFYRQHPELSEAIFDAIRDLQQEEAYRRMVERYR